MTDHRVLWESQRGPADGRDARCGWCHEPLRQRQQVRTIRSPEGVVRRVHLACDEVALAVWDPEEVPDPDPRALLDLRWERGPEWAEELLASALRGPWHPRDIEPIRRLLVEEPADEERDWRTGPGMWAPRKPGQ